MCIVCIQTHPENPIIVHYIGCNISNHFTIHVLNNISSYLGRTTEHLQGFVHNLIIHVASFISNQNASFKGVIVIHVAKH